jgi:hypothetical protein
VNTRRQDDFQKLLGAARNRRAGEVIEFHHMLRTDAKAVHGIESIVMATNSSNRLGIAHAKFLVMLSILSNATLSDLTRHVILTLIRRLGVTFSIAGGPAQSSTRQACGRSLGRDQQEMGFGFSD